MHLLVIPKDKMSLSISTFMFTIALCKHSAILKFKTLNAQVFRYSLALIIKNCHSSKRIKYRYSYIECYSVPYRNKISKR